MLKHSEIMYIFDGFMSTNQDAEAVRIDEDFMLYYMKTLTNNLDILREIKKMYFQNDFDFEKYFVTISSAIEPEQIVDQLHRGNTVAYFKGSLFEISNMQAVAHRSVDAPLRESSLEGGLVGFTEHMYTNINMIRHLYRRKTLDSELFFAGKNKNINTAILYDHETVDNELLNTVRERIHNIDLASAQSSTQLSQHLIKGQWFVPLLVTTERPDRAVKNLLRGRIIILLEGAPEALIAPSTFHDFMSTVDDKYMLPLHAFFLVALRYTALLISIIFPALYVAFTAYNPEVYRVQLALSIAGSRSNVPYPAFIEVIFMLFMMEFLIEASVRLPKTIGQAAATVGGLILGQAATQAALVSNIMIIIVAAVAISNFVMPITSMGLAVRISKYFLLILSIFFGTFGLVVGLFLLIDYIFLLNSFSQPFFNPIGADFSRIFSKLKKGNF